MNINERMTNLKEYVSGKSAGTLTTIYKGEVVQSDDTYLKRSVKQGENFLLISGSLDVKLWKRFPRIEHGDYFYMSDSYWDAVAFKPTKDIYFLGFGVLNQYEKKDFTIKFKWFIDDVES